MAKVELISYPQILLAMDLVRRFPIVVWRIAAFKVEFTLSIVRDGFVDASRTHPDGIDVNVRCLDGDVMSDFEIVPFDGANWEENIHKLRSDSP